jgi:hypothetical protein
MLAKSSSSFIYLAEHTHEVWCSDGVCLDLVGPTLASTKISGTTRTRTRTVLLMYHMIMLPL